MNTAHRATISSWLVRLIAWDGGLPAAVWSIPFVLRWLVPNCREVIELTAVFLPIVAFFVRFRVGLRYISSNGCRESVRGAQGVVLLFGLLVLALIDAVIVLSHVMPKGAAFATTTDRIVWAVLYSFYLAAMAFSMYPGSCETPDSLSPSDATIGD